MIVVYSRTFGSAPPAPPSSNMALWLKTPIGGLSDSDEILTWPDSSGNGKDGTGVTTIAPLYKTNILDGYAVSRWTATQADIPMQISLAGDTGHENWTEATAYVVVKRTVDPGPLSNFGTGLWNLSSDSVPTLYNYVDGTLFDGAFSNANKNGTNPAADLSTNFRLYCVKSKSGDWTNYLDGTQLANFGSNTFYAPFSMWLGQGGTAFGYFGLNADIAELIIYKEWHDDTARGLVEDYFDAKYPSLDL